MNELYIIVPFSIGLLILFGILLGKYIVWTVQLSQIDKLRILHGFFTRRTLRAISEVFWESLLHRNIWKTNPLLGYMHTSFALGWLLLIIVGHIEAYVQAQSFSVPPWIPIFFRYFEHEHFYGARFFAHTMDFLLLYVLSGVLLAYGKRINSRLFGIKRTTKLKPKDRIALIALWGIFPLRLFAESATAALHGNGGFLTSGTIFRLFESSEYMEFTLWTLYSCSLAIFFITLPFTRYMHIPTEVYYIFLKAYGIKLKKEYNSFSKLQVYSCSRCGICIDACQMHHAQISNNQSVYILKNIRDENLTDRKLYNCLLCGRCEDACPVNLNLNDLRISQRIKSSKEYNSSYDFLEKSITPKADVVYFAGCMTHLTPGIKQSILKVLNTAGVNYLFLDKDKGACCGRPLMQAGQIEAAKKLIAYNRQQILDSGAHTLLVSCPICYKVFLDDYELGQLDIRHHSEYFLELVQNKAITLKKTTNSIVYHDPCELGRGCKVYEQPRELLAYMGVVKSVRQEKVESLCCSGSLGDLSLSMQERNKIKDQTLQVLLKPNPDILATSCPLCKKTFVKGVDTQVKDIAEIVVENLI
ncbi:MAG TPA: (Fe-S)-binding protein [Bacteroidales bacterium]|nr:MAG: Anaerobic glycerol-3-phosphate dehydrogenase subunit C [Bacteroidetes bacterium ADurb.Bin217]HPM13264.1 (Fe-S)-binding protein [Bacteroidales bacterium]